MPNMQTMPIVHTMPFLTATQCQICTQCHLCSTFGIRWLHIWHCIGAQLALCVFKIYRHIFSQALEHLHISSECLSDQFDSLVLSLWDWQRKILSRDLLFALTPTSWVARCLARTRRYAANLRPGQSICYSPPESNLKPGNKAKQSNKHFSTV